MLPRAPIRRQLEFEAMGITLRIKLSIALAALQAACHHIFHIGYFPHEWPLKLSVIMGVNKAISGFLPSATVEEVFPLTPLH